MRPKVIANCTRALSKGAANRGIRLGARALTHFRNVRVTFGKSYGHCEVVFEPDTKVVVQVSASIGEPMDSRPGEGVMTVSVWVSPAATGDMIGSSQRPSMIARTIERLFKENRAIDLESLCIKFGEKAWILRADIHVIDMNGCVQEAAALGVLGALLTFRRPNAYIDPDTDELIVQSMEESTPVKLHLFHLPILTSFALCDEKLLTEPNFEEEEIYTGKLIMGINDSKELCYLHLTNPISQELLLEAAKIAQAKCLERVNWLKDLAMKNIDEREVPLYLRPEGPRKTGTVISFEEADKTLPNFEDETVDKNVNSSKKSKDKCSNLIPKINASDIKILEEFRI